MRIELITGRKGGWKDELIDLLCTVGLLVIFMGTVHVYNMFADEMFAQFFYTEETEGVITHVETVSSRSSVRNKHLEIEYINAEGKTRGFWTQRTTKKDVGDKMKVRYSRQGGAVVADTLPELIFDIVMVVVLFHFILLLSFWLFSYVLWYDRRVHIVIRKWKIRLKRKFRRENTSEGKRT